MTTKRIAAYILAVVLGTVSLFGLIYGMRLFILCLMFCGMADPGMIPPPSNIFLIVFLLVVLGVIDAILIKTIWDFAERG